MRQVLAVAKIGKNVLTETDPNSFIFHSDYNTFKIIKTAEVTFSVPAGTTADYTAAHGLTFTPLVTAFAIESGIDQVIAPNSRNITLATAGGGLFDSGLQFNSIASNATNVIANFTNTSGSAKTVKVRYFCLETI